LKEEAVAEGEVGCSSSSGSAGGGGAEEELVMG